MNPLHYLDFDLKFTRKDADGFLLACRSRAFHLPFAPLETEDIIAHGERSRFLFVARTLL